MARRLLIIGLGLILVLASTAASAADTTTASAQSTDSDPGTDAVIDWNANAGEASVAACFLGGYPPQEARMYAMMHVAIHDALNGIERHSRPYAVDLDGKSGSSPDAAVAAAARDVLVSVLSSFLFFLDADCINAGVASVEADYLAALDAIPNGNAKTNGIALGQEAAEAILTLRASDGYDTPLMDPNYVEGIAPGEYRYTPGTPFAFAPALGEDLAPFALRDSSQFRPGKPYSLTSRKYAADVNEVQSLGGDGVDTPSARTDEQTEIARFWVESSPLQWNRIARTVSMAEGVDPWENARLFGLLNIALADGYIGAFETKYHYRFWRPVTAIHFADIDDNPATTADPTWTPLLQNPPIPDYDSGHAVEGGAAAKVLRRFFDTNRISFSVCSFTLPEGERCGDVSPTMRHFTRFSQAMNENAVSRIYVGFHFRDAVETGISHGEKIGDWTVNRVMRPVRHAPPPETTVLDWNLHAIDALINAPTAPIPGVGQTPPVSLPHLAMVQGAVFDAVNMIDGGYEPYLADLPSASAAASKSAAVATAAHDVLVGLGAGPMPPLPEVVLVRLNALYAEALAGIPNGAAKTAGVNAGAAAALAMLSERKNDRRYVPFSFTVGDDTGEWRPTSGVNDPFAWVARVKPFLMESTSQFRTKGPQAINSRAYTREYNEVKDYGGNGTTTPSLRTSEQTALAQFYTVNPVELFNRTFRTISQDQGLTLVEQARLFAMLNLAGADGAIGCWDDKAFWSFWRPITAIHKGDFDGNRRTVGDKGWMSLVPSPPYPDHPSGYNCVTSSFMHIAEHFFGKKKVSFSVVKIVPDVPNVTRDYERFTDVIDDTIDARVFLGIHFRSADVQGAEIGEDVARLLDRHFLEPVK